MNAGKRYEPKRPVSVLASLLIAVGIWLAFGAVALIALHLAFPINTTSGLGRLDGREAAAVFAAHRDDCENLRKWLLRDVGVGDPMCDPMPEHVREDYEAALSRIGAYGIHRERFESEGLRLAIHVGMEGNFFHRAFVDFVWTDGPAPKGQEPVGDDPDFTRYDPLGDGWFVRWGTM